MQPLKVYLDSSDYSVLSDKSRETAETRRVLEVLRTWVNEEKITCWFSATHLSEMAPLESHHTDWAIRRADILVELCGRNALASHDRLFKFEISNALTGGTLSKETLFSREGVWYPEGVISISPANHIHLISHIKEAIQEISPNRKIRRLAERQTFKRRTIRPEVQRSIVDKSRTDSLEEVLRLYPMRPDDARILARYAVGDATQQQATQAFEASLQDPRWMMNWFSQHHDKLNFLIEWTRKPANQMKEAMLDVANEAEEIRNRSEKTDSRNIPKSWIARQDQFLSQIVAKIRNSHLHDTQESLSHEAINRYCPGIAAGVRSLHSAWATALTHSPRPASRSDFVDALHAMYSPYVDIFRADKFMSPYIANHTKAHAVEVVGKLIDLPGAIERQIASRSK